MRRLPVAVAVIVVAALAVCGGAWAHLSVTPGVVEQGRATTLQVELPQLRPGPTPTGLDVGGEGVRQLSVTREEGGAPESRWRVRLRVDASPGLLVLLLRARFAGGEVVEARYGLTVVPAAGGGGPSAAALVGAVAAAAAAAGAAVFLLRRARRRG